MVDVLITGASGLVGSALARRLAELGRDVQATDLRAGSLPTIGLDVTDGAGVLALFERLKPRVVIHCAAIVDDRGAPEGFQLVNVGGTQNVLDAAAVVGVERLVHVSSIAALGLDPGLNADEQSPLDFETGSPYFDTKAASERLVREAHAEGRVSAVIIRPGDVWGPGSEQWVGRPLEMMRGNMPVLIGGGEGLIAHCWIDNLVDGIVLALDSEAAAGGIFTFHDGADDTTMRTYVGLLADAAGLTRPQMPLPVPVALAMAAGFDLVQKVTGRSPMLTSGAVRYVTRRATYSLANSREVLGYEPQVDLQGGMALLKEHFGT